MSQDQIAPVNRSFLYFSQAVFAVCNLRSGYRLRDRIAKPRHVEEVADSFCSFTCSQASGSPSASVAQDEEGTLCIRRPVPSHHEASVTVPSSSYCMKLPSVPICTHITELRIGVHQLKNLQCFCFILGVCRNRIHGTLNRFGCIQRSKHLCYIVLFNTLTKRPCDFAAAGQPCTCTEDSALAAICYNVSIRIDNTIHIPFVQVIQVVFYIILLQQCLQPYGSASSYLTPMDSNTCRQVRRSR